jgi:serine/threonine-protein phosphatase 2B catalytic subunit
VSGHFGFKEECKKKYGLSLYYRFLLCFQCMPLAALVNTPHGKVTVVVVVVGDEDDADINH